MFICNKDQTVAQTKYGKVRGYCLDGNYAFQGIRYARAKRFQMPEEPDSWDGIKDALSYGYVCRLLKQPELFDEVKIKRQFWLENEDCQYLNIWTPALEKGAKKPVMVWLHGGGFDSGSSIEQTVYDGENLSRFGDVVVVSLNHRLNILGYLDLSELGEEYWNTGNLGNADIVAALRWIQDNIEGFGGDPGNVTLFGQSGGGMKVWSLMQTPEANHLFHKGIIQSGVAVDIFDSNPEANHAIIKALKQRNLADGKVLEAMPYEQLAAIYREIEERLAREGYLVTRGPLENEYYLGNPLKKGFCGRALEIPVMIGSVFGEFDLSPETPHKRGYKEGEIRSILEKRYGARTQRLETLFREVYPEKHRLDLLALDSHIRYEDIRFVRERCKYAAGKTYSYLLNYEFALDDGIPAWHCAELPFVFHNADKVPVYRASEAEKRLEEQMFRAWVSFARDGKPEIPGIEWPECTRGMEHILIFDKKCEVRTNFDHELIQCHKDSGAWEVPR